MKIQSKKLIVLLSILLLLFTMSGCGQEKKSKIVEKPKPINEITIAYIAAQTSSPQVLVGSEEKIFEDVLSKKGIKVKYIQTRSLMNVNPMMDKGEIDFAYVPTSQFATYITGTSQFGGSDRYQIIAGSLNPVNPYTLRVQPHIKSLKDLDGKTVGIVNHNYYEEMLLNKALATVGLKTKSLGGSVNVEYQDIMDKMYESFAAGKYEAIVSWASQRTIVDQKMPTTKILTYLNTGKPTMPSIWMVGKKELLKAEPDIVKLVLEANLKANESALQKKDKLPLMAKKAYDDYYQKILKADQYPQFPEQVFVKLWSGAEPVYDPDLVLIKELFDFETKAGYLKNSSFDKIVDVTLLNQVLESQGKPLVK